MTAKLFAGVVIADGGFADFFGGASRYVASIDVCGVRHGLRHVRVRNKAGVLERFEVLEPILPFYVAMCELCDAYDAAKGWSDFSYPNTKFVAVEHGYPTCARCSGA